MQSKQTKLIFHQLLTLFFSNRFSTFEIQNYIRIEIMSLLKLKIPIIHLTKQTRFYKEKIPMVWNLNTIWGVRPRPDKNKGISLRTLKHSVQVINHEKGPNIMKTSSSLYAETRNMHKHNITNIFHTQNMSGQIIK